MKKLYSTAPDNKSTKFQYRPDIDGLRAIAILGVIIFHIFPEYLQNGFIGVDIFFAISGFLITSIILKKFSNNTFNFYEFYSSRTRRIFPGLILVLLVTFIFSWYMLLPSEFEQIAKHIAASASFTQNLNLFKESGYFDKDSQLKPLLNMWSISVEEQFYIIFPVLLWLLKRFEIKFTVITLSLITIFSFVSTVKDGLHDMGGQYYFLLQTRAWELSAGSLLALINFTKLKTKQGVLNQTIKTKISLPNEFSSALGLFLIFFSFHEIKNYVESQALWSFLAVAGVICIINSSPKSYINRVILSNRVLVFIGLISYGLYLWHWPIYSIAYILNGGALNMQQKIAIITATFLLAFITYQFIEMPIRSINHKFSVVFLALLLATIGISGYVAYILQGLNLKGSQTDGAFLDKATNTHHANHDQVELQFPSHLGPLEHKGQMKDKPVSIAFAQSQLSQPSAEFTQNQLCKEKYPFQQMMDITFCVVNKESAPTIIILGTSFANHLYPGLSNSSAFSHHTILSVGRCNISEGKVGENENPANQKGPCGSNYKMQEQDWIGNIVKKSPSIKYAIISGIEADPITPTYIERLRSRIDFLQSQGLTVIVFIPHYIPYVNINDCVRMLPQRDHKCDFHRNSITAYTKKYMPLIDSIKSNNPSVYIFNQNELFCTKEDCSYMKNGGPLSWDMDINGSGGHFSTYGSDEMAKLFAKWANKYLPEILKNP